METLVKTDLFFFVTTVVVIILGAVLTVAAIYLIKVLREVKSITSCVKRETDEIVDDVHELRENIKQKEIRMPFISKMARALLNYVFFTKRSANMKKTNKIKWQKVKNRTTKQK